MSNRVTASTTCPGVGTVPTPNPVAPKSPYPYCSTCHTARSTNKDGLTAWHKAPR